MRLSNDIAEQIIVDYKTKIEHGAGGKLLTQSELMQKYFASRSTIIRALDILKEKNLIYSIQGKGMYFIEDKLELYLEGIYSYDYQLMQLGIVIENHLINFEIKEAPEEIRDIFGLQEGEKVIEVIRKKCDHKTKSPLIIQCNYLRYERFKGLDPKDLSSNRLYVILNQKFNLSLNKAHEQIKVGSVLGMCNKYLEEKSKPKLEIIRKAYEKDLLVEYTKTYLLTEKFIYDIKLSFNDPNILK